MLHYEGPNGHHYGAFLRPGFALTTTSALDRIAFWLLADLRDRSNIVVDHWSMLATGHHAIAYANRFFDRDKQIFVEPLHGYEDPNTLTARLRRAFPEPTVKQALFLLSVNSSGRMAHQVVLPALEQADQVGAIVVALATAPPGSTAPVRSLSQLDNTYRRYNADSCAYCEVKRTVIPIDRDTYLMRLAAYTQQTAITRADTARSTKIVEAYKGLGAFSLHRDHVDGRHHAFYVDLLPMLDTERFARGLSEAVSSLRDIRPQVILHPPTEAAARLAGSVADLLNLDQVCVVSTIERGLPQLQQRQRQLLREASDVLVVDDVVITGRRLEGYRQQLITLRRNGGDSGEVNLGCLVGVARARDARALKGSADFVHHDPKRWHTFAAVETLYLPNWDKRQCPWCREQAVLERLRSDVRQHPLIAARLDALRSSGGLEDIFFPWPHAGGGPDGPAPITEEAWKVAGSSDDASAKFADRFWELNPGSVFGEVQGADLMTSVAAAIHGLRAKTTDDGRTPVEPRLDTRFRSPVSKVLDPDLYLLGRFYEPVLIASILRASHEWDVRSPDGDDHLADAVRQHLTYLASGDRFAGELLVMAALGHLPAESVQDTPSNGDPDLQRAIDALVAIARKAGGTP
ncbi:hypothetical protein SAMN05660209_03036 [Geodermatophilus africanus]|uniref:Uncharacterized protein n=2 Tax=Geodermatophilus africanus TaxID=1137993 RepID=A0A1H3KCY9_9ACTN|nr:hypothetical protein SAMN05660209_03036 [Geodermatophilus africanus]